MGLDWKAAERYAAKKLRAKREKASGAVFRVNDVVTDKDKLLTGFSVEVKRRKSVTLNERFLRQVRDKAARLGKRPALFLVIGETNPVKVWVFWDEDIEITNGQINIP